MNAPSVSPIIRSEGVTYIDDCPSHPSQHSSSSSSHDSSDGSSVQEDLAEEPPIWNESQSEASYSDNGHRSSTEDPSDSLRIPWEVEDEDWELAHGDFTKHYNRLRQQHAAVSTNQLTSTSRPPLPSRNMNFVSSSSSKGFINPTVLTGGVPANPKAAVDRHDKDKSDRATQEQVLDARTRLVLSGLVNRGVVGKIDRCISTGKEANVYYASFDNQAPRAVKIFRTSILNFRSRQAYILGENRFRGEYSSSRNPRKMIRVWAEKELRNLRRLHQGGVRTPQAFECRENVLVMEFLGRNGSAAPRLKDAGIEGELLPSLYAELVVTMRRMFHECHLVHADLSEYNILFHDSHLYIIDVSQSVEHDHPRSFDFLRTDIRNVKDYFSRLSNGSMRMLTLRRTWDFIVDERVGNITTNDEAELIRIFGNWINDEESDDTDDAVFMSSFIPRNLSEVYDPERDVELLKVGNGETLIYAGLAGLKEMKGTDRRDAADSEDDANSIAQSLEKAVRFEDEEAWQSGSEDPQDSRPRGFRHEDKDSKKERKKAVKEEQRERRRTKMSKTEKQRLIKKSSGK